MPNNAIIDTLAKPLKVGDRVAVAHCGFRTRYQTTTVIRVTPTGIVGVSSGEMFNRDGRPRAEKLTRGGVIRWLAESSENNSLVL